MLKYVLVLLGLLALTTLTLLLSYLHTHEWAVPIAMTIAVTKGLLVALWFMHLIEHRGTSRLAMSVSTLLFIVFLSFALLDVASRVPTWKKVPYPAAPAPEVHAR